MSVRAILCYALLFALSAAVSIGAMRHTSPKPAPVQPPAHRGCHEIVRHQLYGCPDGHAYTVDSAGWHDAGPLTPIPPMPRG